MNQHTLYRLALAPEFRFWRHVLFIFTLAIITFNQVFITFQADAEDLGLRLYAICLVSFLTYLLATYSNYLFFVPKLLLQERYLRYIALLVILVFCLLLLNLALEFMFRTYWNLSHRIRAYTNPLLLVDSLSNAMITVICFWGMAAIALFRQWTKRNEDLSQLEYKYLKSEINKLKEQVSPSFMSTALQEAATLTKIDAAQSSEILIQLSHILRYQLYDCERSKVWLQSEINVISNYLKLKQQLKHHSFAYTVSCDDNLGTTSIAPLVLFSLIQSLSEDKALLNLNLSVSVDSSAIHIQCQAQPASVASEKAFKNLEEKLVKLYPKQYRCSIAGGEISFILTNTYGAIPKK